MDNVQVRVRPRAAVECQLVGRRLLSLLTALSLMLCVAVVALWVRSYRVGDHWKRVQPEVDHRVESCSGQIAWTEFYFGSIDRSFLEPPEFGVWRYQRDTSPLPPLGERLRGISPTPDGWFNHGGFVVGLALGEGDDPSRLPSRVVAIPYWSLASVFAAAPALVGARIIRRRQHQWRSRAGLCPVCGYDLRATPGRCPECGHTPAGAKS
jgi:hypothetical protein